MKSQCWRLRAIREDIAVAYRAVVLPMVTHGQVDFENAVSTSQIFWFRNITSDRRSRTGGRLLLREDHAGASRARCDQQWKPRPAHQSALW
jgi:hypothetical protein